MSPGIKHRTGGAWVDGGGPTHAKIGGTFESLAGGTPTTYTIYSSTADGDIWAPEGNSDGVASGAAAGDTGASVGRDSSFAFESFFTFDTSTVVGTITSVTLHLHGRGDSSTTDFIVEARLHDWGPSLATNDWLSRATLSTKTLLATRSTVGFTEIGYNVFTSEAAFAANINQAGATRIVVCSDRHRLSVARTTSEYVRFETAENGTTKAPKLIIEAVV